MAGPNLEGLVNPDMLVWAREESRLDRDAAARKVGVTAAKLSDWEIGAKVPTMNQLRNLADAYKRSVGVFFLKKRPKKTRRQVDFRKLELSSNNLMSPELVNGLRESEAKRDAALEILDQLEEEPPKFELAISKNRSAEGAAEDLSNALGLPPGSRTEWGDKYEALNAWKAKVESLGVLVMQISGVELKEMRGCSISLRPLPVIVLNSSDSPLGRIFTLLHELVHLARSESGICDIFEDNPRTDAAQLIEVYCNRVAGEILVPSVVLAAHPLVRALTRPEHWTNEQLTTLSRYFWASREAVLRRLLTIGKTTLTHYRQKREEFAREYEDMRQQAKGFVTPPRKTILSNGRFLTRLVLDAYNSNVITGSETSRILGTKLNHISSIAEILRTKVAA